MALKHWLIEIRAPFLLLPVILSFVGGMLAFHDGSFDHLNFLLFTAVLVLLHITVNTLNEYYDDRSGIDHHTQRTVFNGGSGMLQAGLVRPRQVLSVAIGSAVIALSLGLYLVWSVGSALLPLLALGMLFSLFYTQLFSRNMLGEVSAGLGLGILPVMGAYLVQTGTLSAGAVVLSLASGLLTFNLLLLNEFPDLEADRDGGRKNLVITFGTGRSAYLYASLNAAVYGLLIFFAIDGTIPPLSALGLLTVPLAYQAASAAFKGTGHRERFVNGQKANVMVVLLTQALVVLGILVSPLI